MASNYAQVPDSVGVNPTLSEQSDRQESLSITVQDHSVDLASQNGTNIESNFYAHGKSMLKAPSEVDLMRNRKVNSNSKTRVNLEHICEDKVSKYKLEEVHTSLPSSVKSTFIMTFSPDGQRVASTHGDHRIYICDLNTGKLLDTLKGHPKTPWCLAWHPINRDILASGCLAGEVRVWDLKSKACESWTSPSNTIIASLDFHPKERVLVVATANDIHFWDWSESEPFAKTTTSHDKEKVKFVLFDSSGTKLITGISNVPKFPGYIGDSLQNRIIDSYLTHRTYDHLSTEGMANNSDIAGGPIVMTAMSRQSILANANEQSLNHRCTLVLQRIAYLYRNLENLEDSMRQSSIPPYINSQMFNANSQGYSNRRGQNESGGQQSTNSTCINQPANLLQPNQSSSNSDPEESTTDQGRSNTTPSIPGQQESSNRLANTLEPFVVSFDEFLANLRLVPLVIDDRQINIDLIIEQYPSVSTHSIIQHESISQVNQNFIRISKLMSSIRLYRHIVQQIISNNSSRGHYQPNQILTVQSMSQKSSRMTASSPIVSFRGFPGGSAFDATHMDRGAASGDPIMAIQFRNSARNVPLMSVCKIDLLISRSVCIMRSQQLLEQTLSNQPVFEQMSGDSRSENNSNPSQSADQNQQSRPSSSSNSQPHFYPLVNQLHQSLHFINRAPLTTSNVHAHISSLRGLLTNLLKTLTTTFQSQDEGDRLTKLIYDIAHGLTGRSCNMPLGATMNDILLDVIHTVCVVDLTLHLTRHVQLVQLQRLSALARIEESRSLASMSNQGANSSAVEPSLDSTRPMTTGSTYEPHVSIPGTSSGISRAANLKRKQFEIYPESSETKKKTKHAQDDSFKRIRNSDIEMIDTPQDNPNSGTSSGSSYHEPSSSSDQNFQTSSAASSSSNIAENPPTSNFIDWSPSAPGQLFETSMPRLWLATAASVNTSQMIWRIYQRLHGSSTAPANNPLDSSPINSYPPHESRRRALSQDNSLTLPNQVDISQANNVDHPRGRQLYVSNFVSPLDLSAGASGTGGLALEPLLRNSFVHFYQARPHHIWFNHWTIPPLSVTVNNSNYRLQCWNFSMTTIPNIKDSHSNVVTHKCRIQNDSSVDISADGRLIACLVPRNDACAPSFDLKIFSLRSSDFGVCYHQWPHGPNAITVSLSPSANFVVVGLASHKFISNDPNEDDLTIAKIFKLGGGVSQGYIRDIKIKRDDSALSLNAIRWMTRGIVYNVGLQHHQRYQAPRPRNRAI